MGLAIGCGFWFGEGLLRLYVFGGQSLTETLLPSDPHELWMRSLNACAIIAFGVYAQLVVNRLCERKERYRAFFENAPDAVFLADSESGQILDANPAASRLLLRPHEEIVELHQSQLHPPAMEEDCRRTFSEHVGRVKEQEKVRPIEYVALRSDGVQVPVEIRPRMVRIAGTPMLQGIFRDLTEWKKVEKELEDSNERFRTVLDSLDALVYVSDMDTHEVLFVNKYGRDTWGDIAGKVCWKTLQAGQSGPCKFCTNEALIDSAGEPTGIHKREFQNTVTGQWYERRDQAIRWTDGRLVRMEIATNITENKRAKKALEESEKLHRNAVEVAGAVPYYLSLDPDAYRSMGPGIEAMTGYSPEEFTPQLFRSIILEGVLLGEMEGLSLEEAEHKVRNEGAMSWRADFKIKTRDGRQRWLANAASHARDDEGNLLGIYGILQDITERKQAEETLRVCNEITCAIQVFI